jgi:hypothetical protein
MPRSQWWRGNARGSTTGRPSSLTFEGDQPWGAVVKASECEGRLQKQRGESGTEPMKGEKYLRFDVIQRSMTLAALAADSNYSIMPDKSPSKSSTKIMGSCFECHAPRSRFERCNSPLTDPRLQGSFAARYV